MPLRALGIDYGSKRVGLSLGAAGLARSLGIVENHSWEALVGAIKKISEEEAIELVVIGLPLDTEGGETEQSRENRAFGESLTKEILIPVEYWDESLTSVEALEQSLVGGVSQKRRRQLDDKASAIMLQEYLDAKGN